MGCGRRQRPRGSDPLYAAPALGRPAPRRPVGLQLTIRKFVAIAVGGAVGAGARWALLHAFPPGHGFPWTVLLINISGSALLGVVLAEEWAHPRARLALHDVAGIGFCGGFTTFSTFAVEVAVLLHAHRVALASTYTSTSILGCIAAALLGAAALRRVRALDLPLEGEP